MKRSEKALIQCREASAQTPEIWNHTVMVHKGDSLQFLPQCIISYLSLTRRLTALKLFVVRNSHYQALRYSYRMLLCDFTQSFDFVPLATH
jgi:hypothetical protein